MEQQESRDQGPDDVLSMGEETSSRWVRLGAVLVVLLVGFAAYRLVSGPDTVGAPEPAAAAQDQSSPALVGSGTFDSRRGGGQQDTQVRLGRHLVTLHGAGVQQDHRETSASALGRFRQGWLVQLTSRACEDRTDSRMSYGVARASGRFTLWDDASTARRPHWRSPDGAVVLVSDGQHVRVRRAATGAVLARFSTAA